MIVKKSRMGRPPAPWARELVNLPFPDDSWVSLQELSGKLNISFLTLKVFLNRFTIIKKYEFENGAIRSKYKMSEIKTVIKNYINQWPERTSEMNIL